MQAEKTNITATAEKLAGQNWERKQKFDSALEALIEQYIFDRKGWARGNPSRADYLEAAAQIEQELDALHKIIESRDATPVDIIEALWFQRVGIDKPTPVEYVYNWHYGVHIVFDCGIQTDDIKHADSAEIVDEGRNYTYWEGTEPKNSVMQKASDIFKVLDLSTRVLRGMPWGNLQGYGGRRKLIETLLMANSAVGYADPGFFQY